MPAIYWLSGLTCTDENFVTKAGAQKYAEENKIILICPDTSPRGDSIPDDDKYVSSVSNGANPNNGGNGNKGKRKKDKSKKDKRKTKQGKRKIKKDKL